MDCWLVSYSHLLSHQFQTYPLLNPPAEFLLLLICHNNFQFLAEHLPFKFYIFLQLGLEKESVDNKDYVWSLQCLKF